jgi:hypothetical protein
VRLGEAAMGKTERERDPGAEEDFARGRGAVWEGSGRKTRGGEEIRRGRLPGNTLQSLLS